MGNSAISAIKDVVLGIQRYNVARRRARRDLADIQIARVFGYHHRALSFEYHGGRGGTVDFKDVGQRTDIAIGDDLDAIGTYISITAVGKVIRIADRICVINAVIGTNIDQSGAGAITRQHIFDVEVTAHRRNINIVADVDTQSAINVIRSVLSALIIVFGINVDSRRARA